jgi:hypothetical protein
MIARAETPQLHLFAVLDLLGVAVAPFKGNFRVCVCVDEHIECAVAVQHRQKGDGSRNLSEDGLDFCLYLCLGLLLWCIITPVSRVSIDRRNNAAMPYSGAAFSLSAAFFDVLDFAFFPNIWTCSRIRFYPHGNVCWHTSNCHRSTCSPVSLLVMTTTSLDILLAYIHSFS